MAERARRLERSEDIKGLRIAYVSDIAGIGVESEIDAICRDAAAALGKLGARSRRSNSTPAVGGRPIRPGAASGWSASNMSGSRQIEEFGPNLRATSKPG